MARKVSEFFELPLTTAIRDTQRHVLSSAKSEAKSRKRSAKATRRRMQMLKDTSRVLKMLEVSPCPFPTTN